MQTQVLFEHPLNEKMRTWLRIEFLIQQLTVNLPIVDHAGALHFFRNVSELLDVFERGEVRTELLKELDRQQRKLQTWTWPPHSQRAPLSSADRHGTPARQVQPSVHAWPNTVRGRFDRERGQ